MKSNAAPESLDYRLPSTPGPTGDRIYQWLASRHCLGVAGAVVGIFAGVGVAVLSAWAASGVLSIIVNRFTHDPVAIGWPAFWTILFVGMPLLIWRTIRTGGEFYAQQVIDSDAFHGAPATRSEWEYRGSVATWSLYGDLLFWGPRLIVDGTRRLVGRDVIRSAATLRRASYVLSHLLQASDAVRTKALRIPEEPLTDLQRVLHWLDRHDYVGISADGQRVWLGSGTRETLCLMLDVRPIRRGRGRTSPRPTQLMDKLKTVDTLQAR